jgi:hypothetical protein
VARPISAVIPTNTPEGKKAYMKLYWKNNKDKKKGYDKKYHDKHLEESKEYAKAYYLKNKKKMRAYMKDYTIKNKAKLLPMWQRNYLKRRARLAGVNSERYEKLDVFKRDNGTCYICSENIDVLLEWPHPKSFSIDHVVPLSKGGNNTLDNVASTHLRCNLSKFNKIVERVT